MPEKRPISKRQQRAEQRVGPAKRRKLSKHVREIGGDQDWGNLPVRPVVNFAAEKLLGIDFDMDFDQPSATIEPALAALCERLSCGTFTAYARLPVPPAGCEAVRYYGPARLLTYWNLFPASGYQRIMHRLDVGLIGWKPLNMK